MLNTSAKELAMRMWMGELSSVEVTQFYIDRIDKHNPAVNAVIAERFEVALDEARQADEKVRRGEPLGALHGLPMTIKDAYEVAGLTCEVGHLPFKGRVSDTDAVVVQRLRAAGAIILGKTNTPLHCADLQTYNDIHGTTNNPHNLAHTPGGSSGGAAAALASGMTPLEFGSDIGGSIRTPSHFCGLFGHKPTFDIVPQRGHVPPAHGAKTTGELSVMGPLARSVDDLELAFDVTVGLDEKPGSGLRLELPSSAIDSPKQLRVGLWLGDDFCPVDTEILAGIEQAATSLEAMGAQVEEAKPAFSLAEHHETYLMNLSPIIAAGFGPDEIAMMERIAAASAPDDKSQTALQARGSVLAHREWFLWNEIRAHLAEQWRAFFSDYDVLICPVTPTTAMPHDQETPFGQRKIWVNGEARPYFDNVVWAGVATLCNLPSTAVPVGRHSNGLPFGLQIVGPEYADRTTMAVARWLEEAGYVTKLAEGYE